MIFDAVVRATYGLEHATVTCLIEIGFDGSALGTYLQFAFINGEFAFAAEHADCSDTGETIGSTRLDDNRHPVIIPSLRRPASHHPFPLSRHTGHVGNRDLDPCRRRLLLHRSTGTGRKQEGERQDSNQASKSDVHDTYL